MTLRPRQPDIARRTGFTIVELMVAVTVIIILISLLIVALKQSQTAAQATNTRALMTSISNALVQFREDTGYLPPVLNSNRNLLQPPSLNPANFDDDVQGWYSETSLADFLIGYGNEQQDGFGLDSDATRPAPGIRHPGTDGVWGATRGGGAGTLAERNIGSGATGLGKIFGPYLQLDNPRLLVAINNSVGPPILFPGDPGYDNPANPKAIADYWGTPFRYYRRAYPAGSISQGYRPTAMDTNGDNIPDDYQRVPTLSNVILLRPQNVASNSGVDNVTTIGGQPIDATSIELESAEYALFSRGSDLLYNPFHRIDDPATPGYMTPNVDSGGDPLFEFTNRDNIVETGK